MFSIVLYVNDRPIYVRNAVNTGRKDDKGKTCYELDTGDVLFHRREDGAVALAKKMLDTIVERKPGE